MVSEKISPAKAQSAAAFPKGFLCAFAGEISVEHNFRAKPVELTSESETRNASNDRFNQSKRV
jgi:hypothetical protein